MGRVTGRHVQATTTQQAMRELDAAWTALWRQLAEGLRVPRIVEWVAHRLTR